VSWDHTLIHAAPGPAIDPDDAEVRFGLTLEQATAPDMRR